MATQSSVWHDTYQSVAEALNLEISTVKRYVKNGLYPAVKFPPGAKRPEVRLMPPGEYQRLHALHFGSTEEGQSVPAAAE